MSFDLQKFHDFMIDTRVIQISDTPFILKSGEKSHFYVNWRTVTEDVFSTDVLADFLLDYCVSKSIEVDCFFGVPEGATKLGILSTYKLAQKSPNFGKGSHVLPMGRGNIKSHGDVQDRYFLGLPKGKKVVVIEDVTTTGSSLVACVKNLQSAGVDVVAAITLTNRHGEPALLETSFNTLCPFYSIIHVTDLIQTYGEVA